MSDTLRKDEKEFAIISFLFRIILSVTIWIVFRDVIGAPNWGAWAVTILLWYELSSGEWLRLIAKRTK